MSRAVLLAAAAGILTLALTQATPIAAGKPAKPADIPVRTFISDADPLGQPYAVQSDGLGVYVNGRDGVVSVLMANVYNNLYNGDWQMDASASNVRRVGITLTPGNAVPSTDPAYTVAPRPPFWGTSFEHVRAIDKCTQFSKSVLTMSAGSVITCPLLLRWDNAGTYRLDMGAPIEAPETTEAQITCNGVDTLGCTDWFIDPLPAIAADGTTSAGTAIARLVSIAKNGTTTNLGDFYLTFHFHITRP